MSFFLRKYPLPLPLFLWLWALKGVDEEGIIVKIRTVKTLGSATVIYTDKDRNNYREYKISLQSFTFETDTLIEKPTGMTVIKQVIELSMWASEDNSSIWWKTFYEV
jgi:hypothetical protein